MLKRIPHSSQDISGEPKTREYLESHEKHARIQFKAFMKELDRQSLYRRVHPTGRFLEIGSGPGFLTAMMAAQYPQAEMNAIEISPDMISTAKEVVGLSQPPNRVRFINGSAADMSLMAHLGKFDLVYSTFSLHHWEKPVQAIKAMYQALKDSGLMLLLLEQLNEQERALIIENDINGRTMGDLSIAWDIPVNTLLSRKSRALKKIQQHIQSKHPK
jgi:ubiquinone/menaquinone biosynthesis C-methylase UbiE